MIAGTAMAAATGFRSPVYRVQIGGIGLSAYAALDAFVINVAIAVVLTLILDALRVPRAADETASDDYEDEEVETAGGAERTPPSAAAQ